MPDEIYNIGQFKEFCEEFDISFLNSDDCQTKNMNTQYKVNFQLVINEVLPVHFVHSVNYCKVDIGSYEHLNIHCDLSTQWQNFKYEKSKGQLVISSTSKKYGHSYELTISNS